ncbi:family 1 glycosylhydrolase [Geodermatophilus sp. CPCC 205506]|uniref:family 1 glycosylhydrolase n=1 Tax=Geodermatophilus sp. CPCC 205506 TaxID=2936596 RepID=UPI003F53674C
MAAQPVMGAMAARGKAITGLPRPDQGVADALLELHRRGMDVLRGAGSPPAGMTLVGREHIAEDGGLDRMREERAAFEDQFLEAVPRPWEPPSRARPRCCRGMPLLVTENGIATADDEDRIRFTTDALRSLGDAVAAGADVRGYVHWSLLDNFEWMLGYRPTFGLVAVDRQTFARTPKPSLAWLGDVARRNAL